MRANCGYADAPAGRELLDYHGPNLLVHIGLDPTWMKGQARAPRPDKTDIPALVDTGAQQCHIETALALEIGLPVIDRCNVSGVGSLEVDVYHAQVYVKSLRYTMTGRFAALPGLKAHIHYSVILGRSFLYYCRLRYDGKSGDAFLEINS